MERSRMFERDSPQEQKRLSNSSSFDPIRHQSSEELSKREGRSVRDSTQAHEKLITEASSKKKPYPEKMTGKGINNLRSKIYAHEKFIADQSGKKLGMRDNSLYKEGEKEELYNSIKTNGGKLDVLNAYERSVITHKKAIGKNYTKDASERMLKDKENVENLKKRYTVEKKSMSEEKAQKYRDLYGKFIPDGTYYEITFKAGNSSKPCYKNIIVFDKAKNTGTFIGVANFRNRPGPKESDPRSYDSDIEVEGTQPFNFSDIKDGSCCFLQEELQCSKPINITHYVGKSIVNMDTRKIVKHVADARDLNDNEVFTVHPQDKDYLAVMGTETNLSQHFFIEKYDKPQPSILIGPRSKWSVDFIVFDYRDIQNPQTNI